MAQAFEMRKHLTHIDWFQNETQDVVESYYFFYKNPTAANWMRAWKMFFSDYNTNDSKVLDINGVQMKYSEPILYMPDMVFLSTAYLALKNSERALLTTSLLWRDSVGADVYSAHNLCNVMFYCGEEAYEPIHKRFNDDGIVREPEKKPLTEYNMRVGIERVKNEATRDNTIPDTWMDVEKYWAYFFGTGDTDFLLPILRVAKMNRGTERGISFHARRTLIYHQRADEHIMLFLEKDIRDLHDDVVGGLSFGQFISRKFNYISSELIGYGMNNYFENMVVGDVHGRKWVNKDELIDEGVYPSTISVRVESNKYQD